MKKIYLILIITLNISIFSCSQITDNNSDDNISLLTSLSVFMGVLGEDDGPIISLITHFLTEEKTVYYCGYPVDEEITGEFTTPINGKGTLTLSYNESRGEITIDINNCNFDTEEFMNMQEMCGIEDSLSLSFDGTLTSDISDINSENEGSIDIKGNIVFSGFWNFTCEVDLNIVEISDLEIDTPRTEGSFCGNNFIDLIKLASDCEEDNPSCDFEEICSSLEL